SNKASHRFVTSPRLQSWIAIDCHKFDPVVKPPYAMPQPPSQGMGWPGATQRHDCFCRQCSRSLSASTPTAPSGSAAPASTPDSCQPNCPLSHDSVESIPPIELCIHTEDSFDSQETGKIFTTKYVRTLPEPNVPPPPPPVSISANLNSEPIYEAINLYKLTTKKEIKKEKYMLLDYKSIKDNSKKPSSSSVFVKYQIDERENRRKQRVEKKIHELTLIDIHKDIHIDDSFYNILEFAENYFNTHDLSSDCNTTQMGKSSDITAKHEMTMFSKSDKIPTSHIHMYDPENVVLSCSMFRVSIF
ncbi:uncharacterized protein Dsimw501_GD28944, partial [Drosophila simulans]